MKEYAAETVQMIDSSSDMYTLVMAGDDAYDVHMIYDTGLSGTGI